MNLQFSILWFDDEQDYFDGLEIDLLEEQIRSWGFVPQVTPVTTPDEFFQHRPFSQFDLIVVDYNLGNAESGQKFIAKIRRNSVYTEVLFYTAGNVNRLWEAVAEERLGGVFIEHRDNILTRINEIGLQTVRKVLDLENMRGIVMAEVGELDQIISELLRAGISSLEEKGRREIFEKFSKSYREQQTNNLKRIDSFSENPSIDEMLKLSDSYKLWLNFKRLRKVQPLLKDCCDDYEANVLHPRNALAHGIPQKSDDGNIVFRHRGTEYIFNDDVSRDLRRTILKYKEDFSKSIEAIKGVE